MKILLWMNIKSHHQNFMINAMKENGAVIRVVYYDKFPKSRIEIGWSELQVDGDFEQHLDSIDNLKDFLDSHNEFIHVVPGYGKIFLLKLALLLSFKKIQWVHWSEHSSSYKCSHTYFIAKLWAAFVNKYALGAIAISNLACRQFVDWGIFRGKIRIVPYALSQSSVNREYPLISNKVRFVFVGNLSVQKGIFYLIDAFNILQKSYDNIELVLVGPDRTDGDIVKYINSHNLTDYIQIMGAVGSGEVHSILMKMDILVMPSLHDGWGATISEAASCGIPIISTNAVGASEHLVIDGYNGFVVGVRDASSLASCMKFFMSNPESIILFGQRSRQLVSLYEPEVIAIRMLSSISSLIKNDSAR